VYLKQEDEERISFTTDDKKEEYHRYHRPACYINVLDFIDGRIFGLKDQLKLALVYYYSLNLCTWWIRNSIFIMLGFFKVSPLRYSQSCRTRGQRGNGK
jgi:hypothetical protein